MKKKLKRLSSFILCLVMLVTALPGATFILPVSADISSAQTDVMPDNGVEMTKTAVYDPATGKVTTTIEAYTTGQVTTTSTTKPTDIVLVLDTSGSMAYSFSGSQDGSNERLNSLKSTINSFIDQTKTHNDSVSNASDKHAIAIVTFASSSNVLANFTTVDSTGAATLKNGVSGLTANGATAVDYGLAEAIDLLDARATASGGDYAEREKVVIVFTDGDPTHNNSYDEEVAHDTVNEALTIKSGGATVYTIGIFNGASSSGTDRSNVFMNYVSSNYPKAYGYAEQEYIDIPFVGQVPISTDYYIAPGAQPYNTGYYLTASDATALNNIFSQISSQIGRPDVELGTSASIVDVVSDYFTIEGVGSNPAITISTANYLGNNTWTTPAVDTSIGRSVSGGDTITINGFDFDTNYISETARDGDFRGKKLIISFTSEPNYAAIDGATFANAEIPTNDSAALLDSAGNVVDYAPSPKLTANTVTYKKDVNGVVTTVGEYLRFPGATVDTIAKPANDATYTYGDWTSTDVTVSGGSFEMPEHDVVLTSTATTNSYTVTFTYKGNVPAGTTPATAPGSATYTVGADVPVPVVAVPTGYAFSGWLETGGDVILSPGQTEFTMLAENLHFEGSFIALSTSYKVEHYLMGTDGQYPATPDHSNVYDGVKTGDTVTATTPAHTGFTFDSTNTNNVLTDTVAADGSTVLKVYYKRNQHTVTYKYDGTVPAGADPDEPTVEAITVLAYYGQTVTLQSVTAPAGYSFSKWRVYAGEASVSADGTTLSMPDKDVVLHGSFAALANSYRIEHYLMGTDGQYSDTPSHSHTYSENVKTGDVITATIDNHIGFTYNPVKTAENNSGMTNGTAADSAPTGTVAANGLVLKLYYDRNQYTVTYVYEGTVPPGASPEADALNNPAVKAYYGETVTVKAVTVPEGHAFSKWHLHEGDTALFDDGTKFVMPHENVELHGWFVAQASSYKEEHYMMDTEGNYPSTPSHFHLYDSTTGASVNATIPAHTGFTFDSTNANNKLEGTVAADGSLTLKVYYKRDQYTVTYKYEGTVPAGANPSETTVGSETYAIKQENIYYGASVDVASNAVAPGYVFSGWHLETGNAVITDGGTKFVMPHEDVVFVGHFEAGQSIYKVEHYFEKLDGGYEIDSNKTETLEGLTDSSVYAEPLSDDEIIGFSYDPDKTAADGKVSGTVSGDANDPLVLKLYYTRTRHKVTYEFTGDVPGGLTPPAMAEYMFGKTVEIEGTPNVAGYTFKGWNIVGTDITVNTDGSGNKSFEMPARDVVLTGHFEPNVSKYKVQHYLEDANGTTYTKVEPDTVYTVNVLVGDTVTAVPNDYNTYEYDVNKTTAENAEMTAGAVTAVPTGTVDAEGTLVLKLYYTRKAYDITYTFENNPAGLTVPTGHADVKHGTSVDLENVTVPAGYTFDGWRDGNTLVSDPFTMPARDVALVGRFDARTDVTYTVEYYQQNLDGTTYTLAESNTLSGTTGAYVVGERRDYPGFTFNMESSNWNGHITGDGQLTLKLYYDRNTYTVTYYYFGTPPTNTISLGATPVTLTAPDYIIKTETGVMYGAPMTVEPAISVADANYEFKGWLTANLPGFNSTEYVAPGTAYTMPNHNLEFRGSIYDYVVYYNLDGGTLGGAQAVDPKHVDWDDANLLPAGTPEKDGMIFSGWKHEKKEAFVSNTDKYGDLAVHTDVTAIVLTAQYANGYTVSYDWGTDVPKDVTLPTDSKLYADGETYTVDTTFTDKTKVQVTDATGRVLGEYVFSGWSDPSNGTINGASVVITGSWTFVQTYFPPVAGNLILTKVDKDDNTTVLPGVKFELYNSNNVLLATLTTDANGVISVGNIVPGDYYLVEIRSAEGYILDSAKQAFKIGAGITTNLVVENKKAEIPPVFTPNHYAYIIGRDDGLVHPEANITRAEVATIFFRLLSDNIRDMYITRENNFTDVSADAWYNTAVSTMSAMGIVNGRPDGLFDPDAYITRAEFAAIAARFDTHGNTSDASFVDIYDHWAKKEINIAANNGWILGYEGGVFKPDQYITRAEAMAMVNRVMQRIPESPADLLPGMIVWPDNMDTKCWYYLTVQEATNSHFYKRKPSGYEFWTNLFENPDWAALEK